MTTTTETAAGKMPAGANAPYKIVPAGNKFVVKNNAGETKATFDTKAEAQDYLQALYANVPGAQKRAAKVPFTGKAPNRAPVKPKEKAELEVDALACVGPECDRAFVDELAFQTHVGTVHPEIMTAVVEEARTYTAVQKKQAAAAGKALPSGGFPIRNEADLKNAIRAIGRAKDRAAAKAHIIKRAKALGMLKSLPSGWISDGASLAGVGCPECPRTFHDEDAFVEHAEAVHTFDDVTRIVSEGLREKYAVDGGQDWKASVYVYVVDVADDWVVFEASKGGECDLYKCSYAITDNVPTFGTPTEVKRRTVYDPVPSSEPDGVLGNPNNLD